MTHYVTPLLPRPSPILGLIRWCLSNQEGSYLVSGGKDGCVMTWDVDAACEARKKQEDEEGLPGGNPPGTDASAKPGPASSKTDAGAKADAGAAGAAGAAAAAAAAAVSKPSATVEGKRPAKRKASPRDNGVGPLAGRESGKKRNRRRWLSTEDEASLPPAQVYPTRDTGVYR